MQATDRGRGDGHKRIVLFAGGRVGAEVAQMLRDRNVRPAYLVYDASEPEACRVALLHAANASEAMSSEVVRTKEGREILRGLQPDLFLLAWWPCLLRNELFEIPTEGCLNFHPSLLPFNRGKHTTFWTLIEGGPFGVSLHFVDAGVDTGAIAFQQPLNKTWEDTGQTLYERAQRAILELFADNFETIVRGSIPRAKQITYQGTFHRAAEIESACNISLDKRYSARDLLNILRAKTFPPFGGAWFEENGHRYEARVEIRMVDQDSAAGDANSPESEIETREQI